jgi:hypothetical protein
MSKKICLGIFLLFFNFQSANAAKFVPGISDLPVPGNFYLIDDSSSIFYNDGGRIIEAVFKGKGEKKNVIDFYRKTLPALGWKEKSSLNFIRENEELKIKIEVVKQAKLYQKLKLYFTLTPRL